MKHSHDIFRWTSSPKFALAGRSPICWRRDLTREISKIGSLRLAGAWIEPLIRMSPALRDGPLFGRCIAELVEAVITKSADDAAHQARPRRRGTVQAAPARAAPANRPDRSRQRNRSTEDSVVERSYTDQARRLGAAKPHATPAQPRNKTDRLRPRNQSGIGDSTGRSSSDSYEADAEHGQAPQTRAAEVTELPQRAGRELLESRANAQQQQVQRGSGETQAPAGASTPRSSLAAPPKTAGDAPAPTKRKADQRRAAAPLHTRQSQVSTKKRPVFNPISQRGGDLHSPGESPGETFAQRLVRRAGKTIRRLRPSIDGEPQASEWLGEQWSTTLAGTAIPGDWLRGLATGETGAMSARRSKGEPKHSSPGAPHHQTSTVQSPEENSVTRVNSLAEYSPSSGERPKTLAPKSLGDSFEDLGDQREDSEDTANRGSLERIAPPSLAVSLPALSPLTPRQTAVTGVLPLASETARQSAREEARSSEDLDALAAKIKFILDEQARRHGIDV